ncbi:hypothetical protein I79_008159 [Cricetulus griseus]|uniref:Uncharacterized protein n=1 Tax=Cricetulus griseus TaxID=10029 RepID=G3HCE9_CRIGR|nr:hypothetical protein I79_008159 [Cricetulus griseus]
MTVVASRATTIRIYPGFSKVTDPDMAPSCSSGPDVTIASEYYMPVRSEDPRCSMAFVHQYGPRWHTRLQAPTALSCKKSNRCQLRPWLL